MLRGILPISRAALLRDAIAGITLAAVAIPEVMGYTDIARMPVITGLYTILLPILVFALLGASRHLVVGADSATAAILAGGLVAVAAPGSPSYVALAGLTALLTAALLLVARLARLGFLADFLSRSVLIGFLTGVGVQVAVDQLPQMLGLAQGGNDTLQKAAAALSQIGHASRATVVVSLAVLTLILGLRRLARRIPGALIAVVGGIALSGLLHLSSQGVATLGTVPRGLPRLGLPAVGWDHVPGLLGMSFALFIVILAQSTATSRAYAAHGHESFDENGDLLGLSLSNLAAGLSGTFVVNGSPTKTQVVQSAGGRSQVSQVTTALIVVLVLLFLTGPLSLMPKAVLASVVFLIGIELIDIAGMRRVLETRRVEFFVAGTTALVVVAVGVEQAIVLAIVLSMVAHVRHGYKPKNTVLAPAAHGRLHPLPVTTAAEAAPGLIVYRFNHGMYYANAERFHEEVLHLAEAAQPSVKWFCVAADAINDIDFTAGETVVQVAAELKARAVRVVFAEVDGSVKRELDRSGLTAAIGKDAYYADIADVIEDFHARSSASQ